MALCISSLDCIACIALVEDGTVCVQLMCLTLSIDGCSVQSHKESLGWSDLLTYDWTVSLCGLVVRALAQNARGVRFDSHQGLYTFQSHCVV